ncbi:MAG: glycosyltransferase family 2 protein [Halothiobacillaceae bacterium]|nr:glycosyltransferase family 2 protein [Halothiobacillaceae bacterium]
MKHTDEPHVRRAEKNVSAIPPHAPSGSASSIQRNKSLVWYFFAPARKLWRLIHGAVVGVTTLDLLPRHQLEAQQGTGAWKASGDDPQFRLRPRNPELMRQSGWFMLSYTFEAEHPVTMQVFIDCGEGFAESTAISLSVDAPGQIDIPLHLPKNVRGLRLDPSSASVSFRIGTPRLARLREAPGQAVQRSVTTSLPQYTFAHARFLLKPLHQISRNMNAGAHWTSHGEDPYFRLDIKEKSAFFVGWCRLDLALHCTRRRADAKFYFDTGNGFNEAETLQIGVRNDHPVQRIFRFMRMPRAVRFDPMQGVGDFRVDTLRFERLNEAQAKSAMLRHLVSTEADFAGYNTEKALKKIITEAQAEGKRTLDHLLARYEQCVSPSTSIAYEEWIESVEAASLPDKVTIQSTLGAMRSTPSISIVMPVYNTQEADLRACIDSVRAQSYPHWELCIADDASTKPHVRRVLNEYAQKDTRIRVIYRPQNGHISRASNSALELASGEFIALLDHDDALSEHALYFMACAINDHPEAQIFYSDEDKIDSKGKRFEPHFKSDWNPDLFYSQNYVSHLGVYRRDLLRRIAGFRVGVEGCQDYDLLLSCLPHVEAAQIIHIPRVLYHWRAVEGSTALASGEKSYTTDAGIKALMDYFAERGYERTHVEVGLLPNTYHIRRPIPVPAPLVSLLIPTRDRKTITEVAVRSILDKTSYDHYEVIILDNGSVEHETLAWFDIIQRENKSVRVIRYDYPFNYSAINNFGVQHARGSLIGLINNDVEVINPDWLTEMVSQACREDIGCVGAKLYYSDGKIQHAGVILGIGGVAGHAHKYFTQNHHGYFSRLKLVQNISAVTAACLLVRKELYEAVGGLDEENLKVAFNDVDFCLKVRAAGYRNLWTPYAELYHHESVSRGKEDSAEKQARFRKEVEFMQEKWGESLRHDPYYNPNLTLEREDFSIGV